MKEWFKAAILAMMVSLGVVSAYGTYSYSLAYKDEKQFDGLKKTSWDGWLSYKDKTGELTGSFKLQTTSGKSYNSKIAGVFINGFGYMSGFTKEKGSIGLAIK